MSRAQITGGSASISSGLLSYDNTTGILTTISEKTDGKVTMKVTSKEDSYDTKTSSATLSLILTGTVYLIANAKSTDTPSVDLSVVKPKWVSILSSDSCETRTVNLSSYSGFQNWTIDYFKMKINSLNLIESSYPTEGGSSSMSYDNTTGILTINKYAKRYTTNYTNEIRSYYSYTIYLLTFEIEE